MVWYEQAAVNLAGLNRTKALKRIDRISTRLGGGTPDLPSGPVGELKKFDGHTDDVKSVTLSADGRFGASGGVDQSVRIWDLAKGTAANVIHGHGKAVWGVAFHPNDRQLFSVSWDATARLWDMRTGNEVKRFTHPLDVNGLAVPAMATAFSPDATITASTFGMASIPTIRASFRGTPATSTASRSPPTAATSLREAWTRPSASSTS